MKNIYVVTPSFNDCRSVSRLLKELSFLQDADTSIHAVVVDDGSQQDVVTRPGLGTPGFDIEILSLKRNVGHQKAIAIGLSHVVLTGNPDVIVIMDGDGEDLPQHVPSLLAKLNEAECDVVVAQRRNRSENHTFKIFYGLYRWFFKLLTRHELRFGNFCAMTPGAANRLVHMEELWMHLPATIIKSQLARCSIPCDRGKRYHGESKMNLVSLVMHGLHSVAVYIESVLARIILACVLAATVSLILMAIALVIKLLGYATPGWLTTAVGLLLALLVQVAVIVLVSILLAINTRNTVGLIPIKISGDYVASVESFQSYD
jgi:hypothetical protein